MKISTSMRIEIDFLVLKDGLLIVDGGIWSVGGENEDSGLVSSLSLICANSYGSQRGVCAFTGESIGKIVEVDGLKRQSVYRRFSCKVRIESPSHYALSWELDGEPFSWNRFHYGWYSPFSDFLEFAYVSSDGWLLQRRRDEVTLRPRTVWACAWAELRCCLELISKRRVSAIKALALRLFALIANGMKRRPLWLFSDRFNKADDNGRALFEYVKALPDSNLDCRFAVELSCSDVQDLRKTGRVVNAGGLAYKLTFLQADYIISAYHTQAQRMPFNERNIAYLKPHCLKPKFIYLRHGISMNDVSKTVGRQFDNARIMIASARREYESILSDAYGYTERELKLCGLTRYDKLYDDRKRLVTLMPTWRKSLAHRVGAYKLQISSSFAESGFFKSYRALLTHPAVLKACREHGYRLQVMLHPNLADARRYFESIPNLTVLPLSESYRKVFAETDLLITDYSSVAFDFAYLRKPVIYFQFDQGDFFGGQYQRGYYDYVRDGFGEVEVNLEAAAERVVEYVRDGCTMKDQFTRRVDDFFAFTDKNNCKRVYEAICAADREDGGR